MAQAALAPVSNAKSIEATDLINEITGDREHNHLVGISAPQLTSILAAATPNELRTLAISALEEARYGESDARRGELLEIAAAASGRLAEKSSLVIFGDRTITGLLDRVSGKIYQDRQRLTSLDPEGEVAAKLLGLVAKIEANVAGQPGGPDVFSYISRQLISQSHEDSQQEVVPSDYRGRISYLATTDTTARMAYALANIVDATVDEVTGKEVKEFVQYVLDESLNKENGRYAKYTDQITALYSAPSEEKPMLALAHAFSTFRRAQFPYPNEQFDPKIMSPISYLLSGQGTKGYLRDIIPSVIACAETENHLNNLALVVTDPGRRLDKCIAPLAERSRAKGFEPAQFGLE